MLWVSPGSAMAKAIFVLWQGLKEGSFILWWEISKIHYWFSFFMCREVGRKSLSNNAALIYDFTCNNNYNC